MGFWLKEIKFGEKWYDCGDDSFILQNDVLFTDCFFSFLPLKVLGVSLFKIPNYFWGTIYSGIAFCLGNLNKKNSTTIRPRVR